ncbi:hypothetical protein L1765_04680 [Microaerobacter geothermalis]|uniref:hypothetical protein n=1 Tax=Microaerobacter geothermalis TaxID=674972 RepID=UPI001F2DDAA4|nr:hypothetical protein [Microaerobacter geothermalis]MCF6093291.1 hypothetical protein [Microaerobacter geothermalis]
MAETAGKQKRTKMEKADVPTHEGWLYIASIMDLRKNSENKNVFWYGFKGHLLVGTKSQYVMPPLSRHF